MSKSPDYMKRYRAARSGGSGSEAKINDYDNRIKKLSSENEKIYQQHGSAIGLPQKYYSNLKTIQGLRQKRSAEVNKLVEQRQRQAQSNGNTSNRTFVNSFGEATTRNITSSSYNRAQASINRAVLRNLGVSASGTTSSGTTRRQRRKRR